MRNETFFSTREFVESWCRALGDDYEPLAVPVTGSGPARTMHVIKARAPYGSWKISSGYSDDFCLSPGWIGELDPSTVRLILGQLKGFRTRSVQWNVRFDHEPLATVLTSLGLSHRRMPVHIVNLERDHERVFARYGGKIRQHIRNAVRRGVRIRSTCDNEDILKFQGIYSELAQEKNWEFIYPPSLFMELVNSSNFKFTVAEYEGSIIGGFFCLVDGKSTYGLAMAHDRKYDDLFPNLLLQDDSIRSACEIGSEFYNLGNAGYNNKSLAFFKSRWGSHIESDWVFLWENPIWRGASKLKAGVRSLLPKRMQLSAEQAGSIRVNPGIPWSQRAQFGELQAVVYAGPSERKNLMMHGAGLVGAEKALRLARKKGLHQPVVLDFGCGTGRMIRFFGNHGCSVVGLDITPEMLEAARSYGLPQGSQLLHFDGLSIPVKDHSIDIVWVCAVLKYTLFPPGSKCRHGCDQPNDGGLTHTGEGTSTKKRFTPTYNEIAKEMHRVLKPGGFVAQYEMWVDARPDAFTPGFEQAGFVNEGSFVLRRYLGLPERLCEWRDSLRLPSRLVLFIARLLAKMRCHMDDPRRTGSGFRDYLFIWRKP